MKHLGLNYRSHDDGGEQPKSERSQARMVDKNKHRLFASTIVGVTHEPRDSRHRFGRRAGAQRLRDVPLRGIEPAEPSAGAVFAKGSVDGAKLLAIVALDRTLFVLDRADRHKLINF